MNRTSLGVAFAVLAGLASVASAQGSPDWHWNPTQHEPSARWSFDWATDTLRSKLVLFGGGTVGSDDTWTFDGTDWLQLLPSPKPAARSLHAMAYDSVRDRVVLFGGMGMLGKACDTWEWDGTAWLQRPAATMPPPRVDPAAAFDANRGMTVIYGGAVVGSAACFDDTWCWNGTNWVQDTTVHEPEGLAMHELAYLPARKSVFVFGGAAYVGPSQVARNELWMLNTLQFPADVATFGQGCTSSAGAPLLRPTTMPWLAESFGVELSGVPANKPWFLMLGTNNTQYWHLFLPAELSSFLMPGCWLYTEIFEAVPLLTGSGVSSWSMTIPNQNVLRGLRFYGQAMVHDPLANARGFVTSNADAATVGSAL